MSGRRYSLTALFAAIVTIATLPPSATAAITAADVTAAIDRGRDYLLREQSPRGTWDDLGNYPGGVTALVTLALLDAGVDAKSAQMQKALGYLRANTFDKTYSVSLQTMALCAGEPKRDRLLIEQKVDWLERNQITQGENAGSWSYPGAGGDRSNSQFAVLALHEAQRVGIRVNPETWKLAAGYWRRGQNGDGSWEYAPIPGPSGSMTCAGIGALVVTSLAVDEGDARVVNDRVLCCQPQADDQAIERGLDWLGRHFSVERNPGAIDVGAVWHYYYLYGVERVGRLTARRLIGQSDWYREGAEYLVNHQDPLAHYWKGSSHGESNPHVATSMAMLFLSKGRRPIVMGKLQHGNGTDWNNHRLDAANLTVFAEEQWDLDLTWQIINPKSASVEDLLQAPVLYISGNQAPNLDNDAKKLRDYIDRGGFIFAESCCGDSKAFNQGFRQLVEDMFPEPEYRLHQLPPSHPIWRMERLVRPNSPYVGKLWAVEYGCRTCVVFSESDLSCYWELRRPGRITKYSDNIEQQIDDAMTIGINVLTYATNREPKGKEQSFVDEFAADAANQVGGRGVIEVAKLRHGGGCDDAPGALANLLRAASQGDIKLRISTDDRLIGAGGKDLFRHHLVFMHGRHEFRFTPAERNNLREYLENGGTLLADSICASSAFTKAFRREMGEVLPNSTLERIPATDSLLTTAHGGYDLAKVEIRDPQPAADNRPLAARVRQIEPQLEGIKIGDRWAVVYSPLDLSCALEKHEAIECRGYTREDAARIGLNVLLYTLNP
ncbi:DUF4159 domain-containing protein [Aeoliella sp. SH292]|uniref:DUF4159 domain-containing protein n=1 Tax=Aeoliella sp. SH292 TaxID=3454464 RepID=UPI003F9759BA